MTIDRVLFLLFAFLGLGLAVASVTLRNLVRSAFALIGCLFVVAALYALLDASLFVVTQVAVYIGAIATLIVLVVMLTRHDLQVRAPQTHPYGPLAAILAVIVFAGIAGGLSQYEFINLLPAPVPVGDSVLELGSALIDPMRFLVPFEAVSILLLSALIGAVILAGGVEAE